IDSMVAQLANAAAGSSALGVSNPGAFFDFLVHAAFFLAPEQLVQVRGYVQARSGRQLGTLDQLS
ncbi:MAG: hypothetical protein LOX97_05780, partial [Sphingomonas sp.]|nr:hypothetical protein [Sphingomonas sp.]